jgi:hypothetical protein
VTRLPSVKEFGPPLPTVLVVAAVSDELLQATAAVATTVSTAAEIIA